MESSPDPHGESTVKAYPILSTRPNNPTLAILAAVLVLAYLIAANAR